MIVKTILFPSSFFDGKKVDELPLGDAYAEMVAGFVKG